MGGSGRVGSRIRAASGPCRRLLYTQSQLGRAQVRAGSGRRGIRVYQVGAGSVKKVLIVWCETSLLVDYVTRK